MSLIQIDGYNPLEVKGTTFKIIDQKYIESMLNKYGIGPTNEILQILSDAFTPGKVIGCLYNKGTNFEVAKNFLRDILTVSEQNIEASYVKGYWSDHFTYNMDLIQTYLNVYPDQEQLFLFDTKDYRFFHSPVQVLSRFHKYVLAKEGKVRQYGAVIKDVEKIKRLNMVVDGTNWLKIQNGKGPIYETNLMVKLLTLALNKYMLLDPEGMELRWKPTSRGGMMQ